MVLRSIFSECRFLKRLTRARYWSLLLYRKTLSVSSEALRSPKSFAPKMLCTSKCAWSGLVPCRVGSMRSSPVDSIILQSFGPKPWWYKIPEETGKVSKQSCVPYCNSPPLFLCWKYQNFTISQLSLCFPSLIFTYFVDEMPSGHWQVMPLSFFAWNKGEVCEYKVCANPMLDFFGTLESLWNLCVKFLTTDLLRDRTTKKILSPKPHISDSKGVLQSPFRSVGLKTT